MEPIQYKKYAGVITIYAEPSTRGERLLACGMSKAEHDAHRATFGGRDGWNDEGYVWSINVPGTKRDWMDKETFEKTFTQVNE